MKKTLLWASGLLLAVTGCQTESLNIQRTFPFSMELDAFPSAIFFNRPAQVGFGIHTDYVTSGSVYTFSWQLAAPSTGVLMLNHTVVPVGKKVAILPSQSGFFTDSLTYIPADSGQHELTLRIIDGMGQKKDTTFSLTVVQ